MSGPGVKMKEVGRHHRPFPRDRHHERTNTMTATLLPSATTTAGAPTPAWLMSGTRWASVTDGLWAGTRDGEFLGTVEFIDGGFETSDAQGVRIGRSHSLATAELLVDGPPAETAVLTWREERTALAAGWLGFGALALTAVALAAHLFL
jgi:hypothetical protein